MTEAHSAGAAPSRAVRHVLLLVICQALAQSGNVLVISATALAATIITGRNFYFLFLGLC